MKPINNLGILALVLGLLGCTPATSSEIQSAYQRALESYYGALAGKSNLDAAVQRIDGIVDQQPGDVALHLLRTQVLLQQLRQNPRRETRMALASEVQFVSLAMRSSAVLDWVEPRLYVTVGDWLLYEGKLRLGAVNSLDDGSARFDTVWDAFILFETAQRAYVFAHRLAKAGISADKDKASVGLKREVGHAEEGFVQALQGIIEASDTFELASRFSPVRERRDSLILLLQKLLDGQSLDILSAQESTAKFFPTLNPDFHLIAITVLRKQVAQIGQQIDLECKKTNRALDSIAVFRQQRQDQLERAAIHAALAQLLNQPRSDLSEYVSQRKDLSDVFVIEPKDYCDRKQPPFIRLNP